jgi:hypothetical protein
MKQKNCNTPVYATIIIACLVMLGWVTLDVKSFPDIYWSADVDPEPKAEEWCLVTTIEGNSGYFGSSGPGEDEYRIIETTEGIHVYQKCRKI